MKYTDKLKDPKWVELSRHVKDIFDNRCVGCGSNTNLNVHHKRYRKGLEPWEYSVNDLVVLCDKCHHQFHANKEALQNFLMNNRLYFTYEFMRIIEMFEYVCRIETNYYSNIIDYLKSLPEDF